MPQNYSLFTGEICIETAQYDEKDCLYNATLIFHGMAQFLSTMPALMSGARMVLAERFSASHFWEDIKHYGCTAPNYVGGMEPILFKADPKPDDADNPLRIMFGAAAPKNLFEAFERMAYFMVPRYLRFMNALPKTPTERVLKYQLRE